MDLFSNELVSSRSTTQGDRFVLEIGNGVSLDLFHLQLLHGRKQSPPRCSYQLFDKNQFSCRPHRGVPFVDYRCTQWMHNHSTKRNLPRRSSAICKVSGLLDDYYLNLLDWGVNNVVAIALGSNVELWHWVDSSFSHKHVLCDATEGQGYITSISWARDTFSTSETNNTLLAIGYSNGCIDIMDTESEKCTQHIYLGEGSRVSTISWRGSLLAAGTRDGYVTAIDVRLPAQSYKPGRVHTLKCAFQLQEHDQEVCGMQFSQNAMRLASGANDNALVVWDVVAGKVQYKFTSHRAAVKAIAWCPWLNNVLASGGGSNDRCIRIWDTNTGTSLSCIDTHSQVTSLQWSPEHFHEIVSTHGFSENQLSVWRFPSFEKVGDLHCHTARVLYSAVNPSGSLIVSASASTDQTMRVWPVWPAWERYLPTTNLSQRMCRILR